MMPCRAMDSTGIKVEGEGEWHARKHGGAKRRVWRKIHLGIDEETLEVCNDPAESAQFKPLMHMPERVFSWQALDEVACGCRS